MGIKNTLAATALALASLQAAHAGTITDNYVGSDAHGYGDVIASDTLKSTYDISQAVITRVNSTLKIVISTGFAGQAGKVATPVGYGDLFLSNIWTPNTALANYANDNMTNGTVWKYALSLSDSDRMVNNASSATTLYKLNGTTNATSILDSATVMKTAPAGSVFRDGQADIVNKAAGTTASIVTDANKAAMKGTMALDDAKDTVTFSINIAGTDMMSWNSFAIHWGETCQNDVIEGITSVVPEPGSIALLGLGLFGLMAARRRKMI